MEPQETFEQAIDRLRDEIAPITTTYGVEEDLNPKYDFIIAKAQELIELLKAQKENPGVFMALRSVGHIPQFLEEIRGLAKGDYLWLERTLNSQLEALKSLLGDPFYRKWHLNIFDKIEKPRTQVKKWRV